MILAYRSTQAYIQSPYGTGQLKFHVKYGENYKNRSDFFFEVTSRSTVVDWEFPHKTYLDRAYSSPLHRRPTSDSNGRTVLRTANRC
jgi:hypothetical protein